MHSKTAKYIHPSKISLEKYENRVIRGLIQLLPLGIGSAIDVVLMKTLENITKERTEAFFDELAIEFCKYKGIFYSLSCAYLKKPRIRSLS